MHSNRLIPVLPLALLLAAGCSAHSGGDGAPGHGEGGMAGDGSASTSDGSASTSDGAAIGDDGGAGIGDDGGAGGPDGSLCDGVETCGDGLDNDCDGLADEGCACDVGTVQSCYNGPRQYAGVGVCSRGSQTCDAVPGSEFAMWGPCEGEVAPGAEVCEGKRDENCDGNIDEGCGCTVGTSRGCYSGPAGTEGMGLCVGGMQTCVDMGGSADWGPCEGEVTPRPELCDGMDYDCDGSANTGCDCVIGTSRACYSGPAGTSGVGICRDGAQSCVAGAGGVGAMWGACRGEVLPEPDTCDGIDHTCTGMPGVGCACILGTTRACYGGPAPTRRVGVCRDGTNTCVAGAGGAAWSGACAGQRVPTGEVCGNGLDDNCNGAVDEGCGGTIRCPGDTTVPAGSGVTLRATGSGIVSYSWAILSAPAGGAATAGWSPNPPRAATEVFTPFIVGVYVIQVTGTDARGARVTCTFRVTALPHGLRIQLRWDGPGDLDLHLHDATTSAPWFRAPNDCYYANRTTPWGATLDFDNTSANGPENIALNTPAIGVNYTVAVHNYSRGAGRRATIDVFCGSTTSTVPTRTFTSRPLNGSSGGNCTGNDFWRVATVRFTSPTACTISPIGSYGPSSSACSSF